jgi:hypothetical protein
MTDLSDDIRAIAFQVAARFGLPGWWVDELHQVGLIEAWRKKGEYDPAKGEAKPFLLVCARAAMWNARRDWFKQEPRPGRKVRPGMWPLPDGYDEADGRGDPDPERAFDALLCELGLSDDPRRILAARFVRGESRPAAYGTTKTTAFGREAAIFARIAPRLKQLTHGG